MAVKTCILVLLVTMLQTDASAATASAYPVVSTTSTASTVDLQAALKMAQCRSQCLHQSSPQKMEVDFYNISDVSVKAVVAYEQGDEVVENMLNTLVIRRTNMLDTLNYMRRTNMEQPNLLCPVLSWGRVRINRAPLLKGQSDSLLTTFLTRFTHGNFVKWDEGLKILGLVVQPLNKMALQRMYNLPRSYLKQRTSPFLYTNLSRVIGERISILESVLVLQGEGTVKDHPPLLSRSPPPPVYPTRPSPPPSHPRNTTLHQKNDE
ncbi:hypothetical protein Pcinc_024392 [Petrolisthes cinctipes]|uniref:Uncharacterized protein n=1 Tax=Petrolisthes cinctipes TaxID=88211 RepID=A0AAE1FB08_PETCI|nr:hypothetical protein Pcinc_024392 [Petrolisthes cinctipes]